MKASSGSFVLQTMHPIVAIANAEQCYLGVASIAISSGAPYFIILVQDQERSKILLASIVGVLFEFSSLHSILIPPQTNMMVSLSRRRRYPFIISFFFWGLLLVAVVKRPPFVVVAAAEDHHTVLVLGATGRTGSLVFQELQQITGVTVRALVRDIVKARSVLGCTLCDASEGIYVGDVREEATLLPAMAGVQTAVIASGVSGRGNMTVDEIKDVEFGGVKNAVRALTQPANREFGLEHLQVVLCSSEGTTSFEEGKESIFRTILFYKLNAEAFLGSVGFPTAVVKPCGLLDATGHNATLLALHDDAPTPTGSQGIPRADVARVMVAIVTRNISKRGMNLRFDLCSIQGPATEDIDQLLDSAQWGWEQQLEVLDTTELVAAF